MTYLSVQYQRYNVLKREEKSMNQRLKLLEERVETLEQQATESDADMH
jgi:prefoldin subunit 5